MDDLAQRLADHRSRRLPLRSRVRRAAVAVVLRQGPEVLLVRRAVRDGDRWSGDMAFPGGMAAPGEDAATTARRETLEEVGLRLGEPLGWLSDTLAVTPRRVRPMVVVPVVFAAPDVEPVPDGREVVDTVWLPLDGLERRRRWRKIGRLRVRAPEVWHGDTMVWGLTLQMLDQLLRIAR